jgi:thiamine-monophosphate kinase
MNELSWIDLLKKTVTKGPGVIAGIGDDCAVVELSGAAYLLKSDLSIEGVHFSRKNMSLAAIGKRAVARVLSDFAACGGWPLYIGISAGLPAGISSAQMKQVIKGVAALEKKYSFSLVGGDTSASDKLFFDVWGVAKVKKPILRSTAKNGDHIFISGKLGARDFHKTFLPRLEEAQYLAGNYKVNAMIDISDGFIIDLYRLLKASRKGAVIFKDQLPLTRGEKDLSRGEDYELIFSVDKSEKNMERLKKEFYYVGKITAASGGFCMSDKGKLSPVKVKGYTHF